MRKHHSKSLDDELSALWSILEKLENGSLSPQEGDYLAELLDRSSEARTIYFEYFQLVTFLKGATEIQAKKELLPVLGAHGRQMRTLKNSFLAAAAMILVLLAIGAFIVLQPPPIEIGIIKASAGTGWTVETEEGTKAVNASTISEGSTLNLHSGMLKLTLESGVRLVLQGPAEVSFPGLHKPVVKKGWLWIDSAEGHPAIRVDTPELRIRDIGTRFGVKVRSDRFTEIHLISGKVEAIAQKTNKKVILENETAGMMIPAFGETTEVRLATDPFPELDQLLNQPTSYSTTIHSQTPDGYWMLNDQFIGGIKNSVAEDFPGQHQIPVQPAVAGIRPSDGFYGFPEDNLAVFLPGDHPGSVLSDLDTPDGISSKEGAVSFWCRSNTKADKEETLWYAGHRNWGNEPKQEICVFFNVGGGVGFFIGSGGNDVQLNSSTEVTDGTWHHIVASWSSDRAELFVNGHLVAMNQDSREFNFTSLHGNEVRFGKPRVNWERQYRGTVDEIAYWNRQLSATEVLLQFQSARGSTERED
jgi:ferric-dicitrate binding protein FerR (iron transport regulator)